MSTALSTDPTLADLLGRRPAIWLRDNCRCSGCRDPRNGQKLFGITDLPARPVVVGAVRDGADVLVDFEPEHRGVYPLAWLESVEQPVDDGRTERGKLLWQAADLDGELPTARWSDYRANPAERLRVLRAVRQLGFALLQEVPTQPGTVLDVAAGFGFVRTTNYGDLFDVRVEAQPNNLAFTSSRITPHTDNPYRDPVPTIQLLHCLENAAEGGDSGLVDGFHAAALLRAEHPAAFAVLTSTPVPFQFIDADTVLRAERPMIDVDPLGRIREVRFNNRSIQPVVLPADRIDGFYAAYRTFAELIDRPELRLDLRLQPGDCLIFDNVRLLHARTAYAESGARHLQGCYADLDALHSAEAVLRAGIVDELEGLFSAQGAQDYLGEEVSMATHMLQAADRARELGAAPALVVAALLHDVGHFTGLRTGAELMSGNDNHHDEQAAAYLSQYFGPEVVEPVRLHVAAKRYLCAVEPEYFAQLSPASVYTLSLQGGPMDAAEVAEFDANPYATDAVLVRRCDDGGKDSERETPTFTQFRDTITVVLGSH